MIKRYWWMFFLMIPLGSFAGLLVAAVITYMMPKKYESEAIIEVVQRHQPPGMDASESQAPPPQHATVARMLNSRKVLEQVAANLDLLNRWNTDTETNIRILKSIVEIHRIDGTDLISIRVRHTNKIDARDIAGELAKVYKANLAETDARESERHLHEINKLVQEQEDKVEERRKVLSIIVRNKGIIHKDSDDSQQAAPNALLEFHQLEQEKLQLEAYINSLLKYENEELRVYAAGLNLPDNAIRKLYPEYLITKRTLDVMKSNGMGEDHPSVRETVAEIDTMRKQLDEGVVKLRATLQAQLDLAKERLESAGIQKDEERVKAIKRSLDAQDYLDAKREFEDDQQLLQEMKLKFVGEKMSHKLAADSVTIHDEPVIAHVPFSPNVTLNLLLGTGAGFLLSPLMALPLMWLLNRRRPALTAA